MDLVLQEEIDKRDDSNKETRGKRVNRRNLMNSTCRTYAPAISFLKVDIQDVRRM